MLLRSVFPLCICLLNLFGAALLVAQDLESYLKKAQDLEKKRDYEAAEKAYQQASAAFPNQPEVFKRMGMLYLTELKFQQSIDPFQKALQGAPQYPEVNFYLGLSYFGLNLFEKAVEAFNRELEANPKYRRAHYYAALAFQSLGQTVDSIQQFEAVLKEDPNDKDVLYQLARLHKAASLSAVKRLDALDPD